MNSPYSLHPGILMAQSILNNMKSKTGKTAEEWVRLTKRSGPGPETERVRWLKEEHGLGTNYAKLIAERAEGKGRERSDPDAYLKAAALWVEAMFSGPKAELRPLYEELIAAARKLGKDVRICPAKTIVPLYRRHVFAQIKPSTRKRIDLGLALAGVRTPKRLIETGGEAKADRITHRIPVGSRDEVDQELLRWLKKAYERDA